MEDEDDVEIVLDFGPSHFPSVSTGASPNASGASSTISVPDIGAAKQSRSTIFRKLHIHSKDKDKDKSNTNINERQNSPRHASAASVASSVSPSPSIASDMRSTTASQRHFDSISSASPTPSQRTFPFPNTNPPQQLPPSTTTPLALEPVTSASMKRSATTPTHASSNWPSLNASPPHSIHPHPHLNTHIHAKQPPIQPPQIHVPPSNANTAKHMFRNFTRKATKIAGDIAFGSTTTDIHIAHYNPVPTPTTTNNNNINANIPYTKSLTQMPYYAVSPAAPKIPSSSAGIKRPQTNSTQNSKNQLSIEYHAKLRNVLTLARNHSMEFYLDYLKFFLKYMDDSEENDIFKYATTRNTYWNEWLVKYLERIEDALRLREDAFGGDNEDKEEEDDDMITPIAVSSSSTTLIQRSFGTSTGASASTRLSRSSTSKSHVSDSSTTDSLGVPADGNDSVSSSTSDLTSDDIRAKIESIPTIDKIDKEVFQDRRIILLLLWHSQILNRLSKQKTILRTLLANKERGSELCIITSNRLKPFKRSPSDTLPKLLKNHISPAHLELIDGWEIRHDFTDFKTNLINLTDRFQTVLDLKKTGYLPTPLLKQYPHFNDFVFLSDEFVQNKLDAKERAFLNSYSSFTAPSVNTLPLRNDTQSLVYAPDFCRLVGTEDDVHSAIKEIKRVLKHGGAISLILFDIKSFKHSSLLEHDVQLAEYVQIYINSKIAKLSKMDSISEIIIKILREEQFTNIKFVKLGIPSIDYHETDSISDNPSSQMSSQYGSTPSVLDQPISSMYAMFSSYMDMLRVSHVCGLHDWINDPLGENSGTNTSMGTNANTNTNKYGMSGTSNTPDKQGIFALDVQTVRTLKLWVDWKLNGLKGEIIRNEVMSRLMKKVDVNGFDAELGTRLLINNNGDVWCNDQSKEGVLEFYDNWCGQFQDGMLSGLDSLFLVTAEKL